MKAQFKFKSFLECIGNTPMASIEMIATQATILAKLEFLNPGGSIKDRAALFMIQEAERNGKLRPGGVIVEASSGNQGIALAMIGALKGYEVVITVPNRTSAEKIATLQAYGAKVFVCPDTDDLHNPEGYHAKAKELLKKLPNSYMPNQYYNTENPRAHYLMTGPEIWQQTNGSLTYCFMSMGSCGTISGVGKYLKEKNSKIKIIGTDATTSKLSMPDCPKAYRIEGMGVDVITETLDRDVIDEIVTVSDEDAFAMTRKLAKKGYLVGLSSGAVMHAVAEYQSQFKANDVIVVILADSGRAYLSKAFV
ncbi:MAG: cysteine synthase family protein [Coxiellaceae bacterium]|jgi:cystathionine beta-synthase|nr:cysteine synthase family protein [Coxiellaceae bacterium]